MTTDPESPPPGRRREWAALCVLLAAYALLFAIFYPPISGIEDEIGYINQAVVWSRGAISAEGASLPDLIHFSEIGGRHVSTRHPGRSLVVLPFLQLGGPRAIYASGLLLHLALTLIAAKLFTRLGRSPLWAVLLLLHPTLAIYSRSIMADAPAGTGLLLAALALTYSGPLAPIAAGAAVALGALMRYHVGMALPLVAASFLYPPGRAHPRRDAAICLLSGALCAAPLVTYNFWLYGAPMSSVGRYGFFSAEFVRSHVLFYASTLLAIWPGMLLAPLLDRSPLRWLTRGVALIFLGPLLFYYFHDKGPGLLETLVVGQRLLQVALPLWIVSYATVVDDWLATPLRRWIGPRGWEAIVVLACVTLLVANGYAFARHQRHLEALRQARDALVARLPDGALVFDSGAAYKLIGVAVGVPSYHVRPLDPNDATGSVSREPRPWYLAVLLRTPGAPLDPTARSLVERLGLERVPVDSPLVSLYICRPSSLSSPSLSP